MFKDNNKGTRTTPMARRSGVFFVNFEHISHLVLNSKHVTAGWNKSITDLVYFTTRVPDTSATRVTQVLLERHKCDTSATLVRNFYFDNDTSENIFSHPYISYMANERLQGEEQFHSKKYLLEMPRSHAKMHLKSAPQKLNLAMATAISKWYTLDCSFKCPCTFPNS